MELVNIVVLVSIARRRVTNYGNPSLSMNVCGRVPQKATMMKNQMIKHLHGHDSIRLSFDGRNAIDRG